MAVQQLAEQHRREDVPHAVGQRLQVQVGRLHQPGILAFHHQGTEDVGGQVRGAQAGDDDGRGARLTWAPQQQAGGAHGVGGIRQWLAVQQFEFVVVGGDQAGLFDGATAQEIRDAGADEDAAADVAHHRIAEIVQVAALAADFLDHPEDHLADGGVAQVAGEHRHAALQDATGA